MEPEQFQQVFKRLEAEVQKVIVGHHDVIRKVLVAFFGGGHVLLEGVPGLGKIAGQISQRSPRHDF
jgi:MoxR-like ATPase